MLTAGRAAVSERLAYVRDANRHRDGVVTAPHFEPDLMADPDLLDLVRQIGQATNRSPLARTMTSPSAPVACLTPRNPACAAGEPGTVRTTTTPSVPSCDDAASLAATMPMPGFGTCPPRMSSGTIRFTKIDGNGKSDAGI
jgi:hypothetical protein